MTISAKGLPDGVTTDISQAHFPLGNDSLNDPETAVCITEGPLKADAAVELKGNRKIFFIAAARNVQYQNLASNFRMAERQRC